ncbi:MAG: hypothetical protein JOZ57_17475, partial [Abitibacteriaceae bacterium]|nr:hypothetical protein [Abditibacteriaceae bacterium]
QGREAQRRPCRLEAKPLQEATDWMEQYRQFWDESFDRLDDYLKELQSEEATSKEKKDGRSTRKRR